MHKNRCLSFGKYSKANKILSFIVSAFFLIVVLVTNNAYANFESTESSSTGMCPANHKMYYIGATPPLSTTFPVVSQPLNWTAGNTTRTFTFNEPSGNKTFNISFSSILDKNNSEGTTPFYGSINGSTSSALNLVHDSTSTVTNHVLNISINRSISKSGYKIQDVDSLTSSVITGYFLFFPIYGDRTPYIEQVDVSANNGRLTFNSNFHTANNPAPNTSIVTGIRGSNCSNGECNIDASWGYKAANSVLNLKHNNTLNETSGAHAVGYSDFYFCLAPPKLVVNKQLNGTRANNTDTKRDQFEIKVTGGSIATNSVTTTGTGATISNGSSSVLNLAENTTYTITERVMNGTTLGDVANYNATYTCTNATTGSTTVMPTAAMTDNATAKTRSFTLSNVTYGDEITCTITNSPASYTFSGIVFNDNGGIVANIANQRDTSTTFTNNSNYANGIFNSNESGISASGLQIKLTDCNGNTLAATPTNPQTVSSTSGTLGRYSFSVTPSALSGKTKVCLIETEPSSWDYMVDTTDNTKEVALITGVYAYKTEKDASGTVTRNLDFGEVKSANAPLVLKKYQYVHQCNDNLNYTGVSSGTDTPITGFSINPASNIEPEQCIAYKVEAYNRGHIDLTDVQITDKLQSTPVRSVFHLPKPLGSPAEVYQSSNTTAIMGANGTIISDMFNLAKVTSSTSPPKVTLYFNSRYGTTNVRR